MKLKKIASVALAGVMAVGVLAGCGANSNANSGNTNTDTTTSTAIVDVVNNGQDSTNLAKIDFTSSASLDKDLKTAVETLGLTATGDSDSTGSLVQGTVSKAIANMSGLKNVGNTALSSQSIEITVNGAKYARFVDNRITYDSHKDSVDKVYTVFGVESFDGATYPNEEAVMNKFAAEMNTVAASLVPYSNDSDKDGILNTIGTGDEYFAYTYTGNVSIASVAQTDGTVDYFVAFVINQNVATKTL